MGPGSGVNECEVWGVCDNFDLSNSKVCNIFCDLSEGRLKSLFSMFLSSTTVKSIIHWSKPAVLPMYHEFCICVRYNHMQLCQSERPLLCFQKRLHILLSYTYIEVNTNSLNLALVTAEAMAGRLLELTKLNLCF